MMLAKKLAPFSQAGFLKTGVALASRWPAPSIAVDPTEPIRQSVVSYG